MCEESGIRLKRAILTTTKEAVVRDNASDAPVSNFPATKDDGHIRWKRRLLRSGRVLLEYHFARPLVQNTNA